MSTKIFDAYRIRHRHLPQLLQWIQDYGVSRRKEVRRDILHNIIMMGIKDWEKFLTVHKKAKMRRFYKLYRNIDFLYYLHIDGWVYLKFFGDDDEVDLLMQDLEKRMEANRWPWQLRELQDYHYQNSTDRPKGVSEKDWDEREETWDTILKIGGSSNFNHFNTLYVIPDFLENEMNIPFFVHAGMRFDEALEKNAEHVKNECEWAGLNFEYLKDVFSRTPAEKVRDAYDLPNPETGY